MVNRPWRRSFSALLLLLAGVSGQVAAAEGGDLEHALTGGSSRAWMTAAEGVCGRVDSFTFATGHQLAISRCDGRQPVTTQHTWSLKVQNGTTSLVISELGAFNLSRIGTYGLPDSRSLRLEAAAGQGSAPIELWSPPD